MKKSLLAVCGAALFAVAAATALAQSGDSNDKVRDQLVGGWRLVSLESQDADGKPSRVDCCGMFVFTRDGHMSVQVMQPALEAKSGSRPDPYSQGGYEATYGSYRVDASAHTFTIHVEGALARALVGKDLPRVYKFSGKQLIVTSTNPDEHWRATWEHY